MGFLVPKRHQMKHLGFSDFVVGIQAVKLICNLAPKYTVLRTFLDRDFVCAFGLPLSSHEIVGRFAF